MTFWNIIKYILLGLIQGFTEPLPISSSAHMVIASHYLGITTTTLNFEILIHFASFLGIFYYFRKDIIAIGSSILHPKKNKSNINYIKALIIASIPAIIGGLLLKNTIETHLNTVKMASFFLLITSVILYFTSRIIDKGEKETFTYKDSFIIGLFQMGALFPGISRSASTLFGGKLQKGNTKTVLHFSFFLYLIVSFGAFILSLKDFEVTSSFGYDIITFVSAFFATLLGIRFLHKIISKKSLVIFSLYTLFMSLLVFLTK